MCESGPEVREAGTNQREAKAELHEARTERREAEAEADEAGNNLCEARAGECEAEDRAEQIAAQYQLLTSKQRSPRKPASASGKPPVKKNLARPRNFFVIVF
jgi:chromosome segregation ATPase